MTVAEFVSLKARLWLPVVGFALALSIAPIDGIAQTTSKGVSCDERYQEMSAQAQDVKENVAEPEAVRAKDHLDQAYQKCLNGDQNALDELAQRAEFELIFGRADAN